MRTSLFRTPCVLLVTAGVLTGLPAAAWEEIEIRGRSSSEWRRILVDDVLAHQGITNRRVLDALRAVPRHLFVPPKWREQSYRNHPLPIGEGQTISQPFIVAYMTQLARVRPKMKVFEVGTGSGYQAAVLAEMGADVFTVEIVPPLGRKAATLLAELGYDSVHVRIGDGYRGWPEEAPFQAIIVTAAPGHVPQPLIDQLAVGGRMVIPVGEHRQTLRVILKTAEGAREQVDLPVRFVPMTGEAQDR